ncbi:glycosyltransferase family 2 protein [Asticcacaulis machinosus]|uniref:Glycosyltransferase family 2 protein n=1 Tax=Asticcacaulis machinosus TaxID=2984211 RepID=A0ABT5HNJ0_9CAUL|nr:glycosyltransferase family 2 protein [Asticcacaulis machinosus]MDC7677588.1 glycosyltransferase family 2 protein [Asticcacaulis machinosus]
MAASSSSLVIAPPLSGVSVIMVAYHTGKILFDSIRDVLRDGAVAELILVDNGSTPEVERQLQALARADNRVTLLQGHGNIGFGRAVNLGAKSARQPWLVILNPDASLKGGTVEKLVAAAQGQPSPCIVGARVLNTDGTEQRGARRGEVTPVTTLVSLLRLERFVQGLEGFELHHHDKPLPDAPMAVPTISGACFAISKVDFDKLDGFDPEFFLHVEDVDLCWRARKMGGIVLFHPHAEVIHEGHTSHVAPTFVEWNKGKGLVYFFNKRADTPWRKLYVWALGPLILMVSLLRSALRPRMKPEE